MGILEEIMNTSPKVTLEESISGLIRKVVDEELKPNPSPKSHYTVTQLINPIETFFSRICPDVTKPHKLGRKLARGRQLHNFAAYWFREVPDFVAEEGSVDGIWVGIDRVRGRIDYLIKDSLVEFKTKDKNPIDEAEIFSKYPQDLEQLAFYSVIHPANSKINYLVFMENTGAYTLKAFRVEIKDFEAIKKFLLSRIGLLDTAFQTGNPRILGRCRYYQEECKFTGTKICICEELEPLSLHDLEKSIVLTYDPHFSKQLDDVRKSSKVTDVFSLSTIDMFAPRKHYMYNIFGVDPDFYSDPLVEEYKACLWVCMNTLKKREKITLDQTQIAKLKNSIQDHRLSVGFRWLNYKQSGHDTPQQIPYLLKASRTKIRKYAKAHPYNIAELGMICGLYKKTRGLIITVYPFLNNLILTYNVEFRSEKELMQIVKKYIDNIETAEKNNDLSILPRCLDFQCPPHGGGSCHLKDQCFPLSIK